MKYKIHKPNFKNQNNYTSIPNAMFSNKDLSNHEKNTLYWLMSHKDGFEMNEQFIQNGLKHSNWMTQRNHIEKLQSKGYMKIDNRGNITFNLEKMNANEVSTNEKTTNEISTHGKTNSTNGMSTETTNGISTESSRDEYNDPHLVSTNNKKIIEKQYDQQEKRNNSFSEFETVWLDKINQMYPKSNTEGNNSTYSDSRRKKSLSDGNEISPIKNNSLDIILQNEQFLDYHKNTNPEFTDVSKYSDHDIATLVIRNLIHGLRNEGIHLQEMGYLKLMAKFSLNEYTKDNNLKTIILDQLKHMGKMDQLPKIKNW